MIGSSYGTVSSHRPVFALTMGDPAGIGPEIACKALEVPEFRRHVVVVGDYTIMNLTARRLKTGVVFREMAVIHDFQPGMANILTIGGIDPATLEAGTSRASYGMAAYTYIDKGIELALNGEVDGVITNPINKESLRAAGLNYPGHTEIFAEKTGIQHFSMLFLLRNVGVAHVTTHCSLRRAIEMISADRVISHIRLLHDAMIRLGVPSPRIAVGGLNPHAGENGLFGMEEIDHIVPAIKRAGEDGMKVSGPYPPDTVFMRAFRGEFDGVVAMLHDHGFVALKSMDFEHGVNITIGLPIIRTSVGHGTAFNIAGKNCASPRSLLAAFDAARRLYHGPGCSNE